jgi:hypothetical protein
MSKCRERSSKPARRVIRTSLPSHAVSNSARVMSEGRGDDGDCTSTLSSPALARKRNPPSLSAAIAGSGVLARRGHALFVARALSPSSFPSRSISAMPTGEPPKRWRICSGSAPMPLKRSSVTRTTSPGSAGFKFVVCVNMSAPPLQSALLGSGRLCSSATALDVTAITKFRIYNVMAITELRFLTRNQNLSG